MLVSHRKKFIYIKTIKTAGTSVESYFEKYCMPEGEWNYSEGREEYYGDTGIIGYRGSIQDDIKYYSHMPGKEIKSHVGDEVWDRYFKFCVIRNPFDKMISLFYFMRKENQIFVDPNSSDVEQFKKWILNHVKASDNYLYLIDGKVCVDFFIKYENLVNDIHYVCDRLDIPFEPAAIPRFKAGHRDKSIPISSFYDDESISIINKVYALEIELFNYKLPC